ncbi:MAG: GNAT family N-acetyltransferase [Candidatus Azobacteroides sp.]|nr:GNAT family N-acetyltransferase [Candidatus Azobacteroides sp.]
MIYMETSRLILRGWKKEDIYPLIEMNADPRVMEFFLNRLTEQESLEFYDLIQQEFHQRGYGLYAMERKEDNVFLGCIGFHHFSFDVDFAPGVEIMWRIRYPYWNQGYTTEAAKACLEYAAAHLPFDILWSFTSLPNKASERVMQKIGMEKERIFPHPVVPDGHPLKEHVLYKAVLRKR